MWWMSKQLDRSELEARRIEDGGLRRRGTRVLSSVTFTTPLGAIKLEHPIVPCGERFGDVDAVLFGGSQPPRAIRV